jgi:hypothetical protein
LRTRNEADAVAVHAAVEDLVLTPAAGVATLNTQLGSPGTFVVYAVFATTDRINELLEEMRATQET